MLLGAAALVVAGRLVTLPVSAYGEIVRHRYGLSTRSWGLWLRDVAVATAINAALTALALCSSCGWPAGRRGPGGPGRRRPPPPSSSSGSFL